MYNDAGCHAALSPTRSGPASDSDSAVSGPLGRRLPLAVPVAAQPLAAAEHKKKKKKKKKCARRWHCPPRRLSALPLNLVDMRRGVSLMRGRAVAATAAAAVARAPASRASVRAASLRPAANFPSYLTNIPATEVTTLANGVRVASEVCVGDAAPDCGAATAVGAGSRGDTAAPAACASRARRDWRPRPCSPPPLPSRRAATARLPQWAFLSMRVRAREGKLLRWSRRRRRVSRTTLTFTSSPRRFLPHAGSRYETEENNGAAHFLEHITFKVRCWAWLRCAPAALLLRRARANTPPPPAASPPPTLLLLPR